MLHIKQFILDDPGVDWDAAEYPARISVKMAHDAKIMCVAHFLGEYRLYVSEDRESQKAVRRFMFLDNGDRIPEGTVYIGSCSFSGSVVDGGPMSETCHIFEDTTT